MRLSGLLLFLVLLFSPLGIAQHSSGGSSGGSSAGSSGGGGGSHGGGGSSGGSSASSGSSSHSSSSGGGGGGGHSSGGHVSGGNSAGGHSTGGNTASGHAPRDSHSMVSHHSDIRDSHSNNTRFSHESSRAGQMRTAQPEKRGFFSFLRHPFRLRPPEPKPISDLRRPVCLRGPCQVCPNGQIGAKGGCGGVATIRYRDHVCSTGMFWNGAGCFGQSHFLDYCSAERQAMDRQAERLNGAQSLELSACANTNSSACVEATGNRQKEESLYRQLKERYQQCMRRSPNTFSLSGRMLSSYRRGLNFDPQLLDSMELGTWQNY